MRVALVRPAYYTHLITPPLGLGYLAGALQQEGIATQVVDGLNLGLSREGLVARCAQADLVGISCLTDYMPQVSPLARALTAAGKRVVLGGPHVTALPEAALRETGAAFAVVGEGERSLPDLVRFLEGGSRGALPPGVATLDQPKPVPRALVENLDNLPFPAWQQLDPRGYRRAPHGGLVKRFPVAPIISSRGCPFECTFCASPTLWGRRIRFRSAGNVLEEISWLVKDFGVREIHFEDDNLTLRRDHVEAICQGLLERRLKVSWATPNGIRVDAVDPALFRLMKRSGCYYTAFGIESGSQAVLGQACKQTDLATIARAVGWAREAGIMTQGFFIFGLPGETRDTIEETIRFARRIPLDRGQFLLLDLLPGSRLWEERQADPGVRWEARSYQQVKWVPPGLDAQTLQAAPGRAFRAFFLRPTQLLRLVRLMRPSQLPFVWQRLKDFGVVRPGR